MKGIIITEHGGNLRFDILVDAGGQWNRLDLSDRVFWLAAWFLPIM